MKYLKVVLVVVVTVGMIAALRALEGPLTGRSWIGIFGETIIVLAVAAYWRRY